MKKTAIKINALALCICLIVFVFSACGKNTVIVENVLNPMIQTLAGDEKVDIKTVKLSDYAEKYLVSGGMKTEQLEAVKAKIIK